MLEQFGSVLYMQLPLGKLFKAYLRQILTTIKQ